MVRRKHCMGRNKKFEKFFLKINKRFNFSSRFSIWLIRFFSFTNSCLLLLFFGYLQSNQRKRKHSQEEAQQYQFSEGSLHFFSLHRSCHSAVESKDAWSFKISSRISDYHVQPFQKQLKCILVFDLQSFFLSIFFFITFFEDINWQMSFDSPNTFNHS